MQNRVTHIQPTDSSLATDAHKNKKNINKLKCNKIIYNFNRIEIRVASFFFFLEETNFTLNLQKHSLEKLLLNLHNCSINRIVTNHRNILHTPNFQNTVQLRLIRYYPTLLYEYI